MDLLTELEWRGLLYQASDGAAAALRDAPIAAYCGFDPTGPSLHVGSLIPIMGLIHVARAGHRPIALVGGGTGLIGDPSGRSTERALLPDDTVADHVSAIREQLERLLGRAGVADLRVRDNAEWLRGLGAVAFLRDVGKHFTVNFMLAKDSVQSRLESGISFTEFSYMLLQAYDFLELFRRDGVTLQVGGSDQWGNMTAGMELIRRVAGGEAHVITFPLLTTASGTKFGKSEGGAIWLDAARTSPYRFYQFWINTDDRDVVGHLRRFTLLDRGVIEALEQAVADAPGRREAQTVLAREVTTFVHGAESARIAAEASAVLFGRGDPRALDVAALAALAAEVPSTTASVAELPTVADLFVRAGLARSKGEARRLADQGGTYVNGERVAGTVAPAALPRLAGSHLLLRKGARDYALVRLAE